MTLGQIMRTALLQLDEDPADMAQYAELFRRYANEGYREIVTRYWQPTESFHAMTGEQGGVRLEGYGIRRVRRVQRERDRSDVRFALSGDGRTLHTALPDEPVLLWCEMEPERLVRDTDEPAMPESAHGALCDYICYRHLMNGNLAKQSRAQAYRTMFYEIAGTLRSQGQDSVRQMRGLYEATDIRRA